MLIMLIININKFNSLVYMEKSCENIDNKNNEKKSIEKNEIEIKFYKKSLEMELQFIELQKKEFECEKNFNDLKKTNYKFRK